MIWKKYKEVVVVLLFLTLMGLIYFFVISQLITEIGNKRNKLREFLAIEENQQKKIRNLPQIRTEFEKLEELEKKIKPFWDKNETVDRGVELIQEIEKLAESTGNEVSTEVVLPEAPAKGGSKGNNPETIISSLPIKDYVRLKIKINGSFFSLLKLLSKIENSSYYLDIISLQVSRNQEAEKEDVSNPISKNPFDDSAAEEKKVEIKTEQTVSVIDVVVYTKSK